MHYADLRLRVQFRTGGRLPTFRGPTIRGALGYTLKRVVCHVRSRACAQCFLRTRCAYPLVFEGVAPANRTYLRKYPHIPQPFVLVVDGHAARDVRPDDRYEFALRLFGPAIELHPFILMALVESGRSGLGRDRLQFEVVSVDDGARELFRGGEAPETNPPNPSTIAPVSAAGPTGGRFRLRFETPVRLRTDGRLNTRPTLAAVVRAAIRRIRVLNHFYGNGALLPEDCGPLVEEAAEAACRCDRLRWMRFQRFSTRQQRTMTLGGAVGELPLERISPALAGLLHVASIVHVGKATSFGFGRITLEPGAP